MKQHFQLCFIETVFCVLLAVLAMQQLRAAHANALLGSVDYRGNETDYMALLAIKRQLVDIRPDDGVLRSWNQSVHHCHWEGVACGPKHNRVIKLDLKARSVGGTISPSIGNLSFLTQVDLHSNSLSGPIPPEIGRLRRLQELHLHNNTLSGEIPDNISGCVSLQYLSLAYNHLHGELPMGLGALSNLKYLWIYSNYKLNGSIFKVIANLSSLEVIKAYDNDFTGTISPSIGNLSFLTQVDLRSNSLSGSIPPEIGRLRRLQQLYLYNNTLSGEIPGNISGCVSLQNLSLAYNHLHGELPMGLGALSNLKYLWIYSNYYKLAGPIFNVIVNLTSLEFIDAYDNAFTGNIPNSISRMTNLNWLNLYSNKLSGTIPPSIFNLSSLQELYLDDNQLQGSIPPYIAFTLPQLKTLSLDQNHLTGPLPISIQNLTTLQQIGLHANSFTGRLSINFGNLHSLRWLGLSFNHFEGDITSIITTLLNCTNLKVLYLNSNNFTGVIPEVMANLSTSLTVLNIGDNPVSGGIIPKGISNLINIRLFSMYNSQLTGTIPHEIGNLQKLEQLYLSSNKLTGEIPYSFGNLSHLSSLDLADNHLQGRIPPSLGRCENLIYLYLYDNNFNGPLPQELFAGSAKFVKLSLSNNQLQGSLPMEIKDQTQLEEFYVSANKLSGEIPQGLGSLSELQYLSMGVNFFHGPIPSSFASLKSLAYFGISQNNISGLLPQYFSTFPFLIYLNLAYNNFEGNVPTKGVYANASSVFLDGNSKLCGGIPELHLPRCVEKRIMSHALKLAISITCPFFGVLTIATCIWCYLERSRRKRKAALSRSLVKEPILKVSYDMLLKATNGFSPRNLLGSGAFGSVYKGVLDGITIAVKVLNLQYQGGSKCFMAECEVLRNIRHRNLVGIITACSSIDFRGNDFKALVFEFMPNGNLDGWLHQDGIILSLLQRVDIAVDVAHALNYIHHECEFSIVHCDLKPSNILLDHDMVAHVADFGLAKVLDLPVHPNQSSSIGVRGTIGYAAPEYGMGGEVSIEADLYSFGILLLELMTRKRPTDDMFNGDLNLHMYAKAALSDQVLQIVDSSLLTEDESEEVDSRVPRLQERLQRREKCITSIVRVGLACSSQSPRDRMKMGEAISELIKARNMIHNPKHRLNFA